MNVVVHSGLTEPPENSADLTIWFKAKEAFLRTTGQWVKWERGTSIKQSLGEMNGSHVQTR